MADTHQNILIRGGRIIDPGSGLDAVLDLWIEAGVIAAIGPNLSPTGPHRVISAMGQIVAPGFIDLHTHLREPGFEYKETIATATEAAVAGGFTTLCAMPNSNPVNDHASVTEFIRKRAERAGFARVLPVGAITKGLLGKEMAEMGDLVAAGCVAVSDDGHPVSDSEIMRRAMEYSKIFNIPVIDHCEDLNLTADGIIFEGMTSTRLGLKGIPAASETVMVARDILLAELTGARVHLAHISTAGSVSLIREAKRKGIAVTAETAPHYFTLTHEQLDGFNGNAKMKPPLASSDDLREIRAGLADGTLTAIATDHAPHAAYEKAQEIAHIPFGIVGLETALPLSLRLVEDGVCSLSDMIRAFTTGPAAVLGRANTMGCLAVGRAADVTLIDPEAEWVVDATLFKSKGRNSPFIGWKMRGRATAVIVQGKVVENG